MRSLLDAKIDKKLVDIVNKLNGCNIEECFDIVVGEEFTVNDKGIYKNDVKPVSK